MNVLLGWPRHTEDENQCLHIVINPIHKYRNNIKQTPRDLLHHALNLKYDWKWLTHQKPWHSLVALGAHADNTLWLPGAFPKPGKCKEDACISPYPRLGT